MAGEREFFPQLPDPIQGLGDLAYNLWWSWHPAARMLFKQISRSAWKESIHNPVKMLRNLQPETIAGVAADADYLSRFRVIMEQFRSGIHDADGWFPQQIGGTCCLPVAYFSAEYGLHHSLPFYAGGLGFLAGDYLKECSDLAIPLVGVGFMYPEGYTRQKIREDGWQDNDDDILDRDSAPITRVQGPDNRQLVVEVPFIRPTIHVAVWKAMVGRIPLYLMDTDIPENDPWNRLISSHLYSGDIEQRIRQEIVLGIGGSAMLNRLGIRHAIAHLNEGHPAFALLERIRERINEGMSFAQASAHVRNTTVFTTHTPVKVGNEVFPFHLVEKYFAGYYPLLGLDREAFLRLGIHPEEPSEGFNMTAFALRLSRYHNAVSRRHGQVSRHLWRSLWPEVPEDSIPIGAITNGVHVPTWIDPRMEQLLDTWLGSDWLADHDNPARWESVDRIPDEALWRAHLSLKTKLFHRMRDRVRQGWAGRRLSPAMIMAEGPMLNPFSMTIGFARRFASYKRAELIFSDVRRLEALVCNAAQPVQIIFAGKAHPSDDAGKRILQQVFNHARDPETCGRIAFVENYDEQMAQYLVHGVDVWLNTPLPPLEACGTSGMKAGLNGVPHLSIPDGWWLEGFNGRNGWSFGGAEGGDRDRADADALYSLLETTVVPLFYDTGSDGIPHGWVKVMKEAMKSAGPAFSARRMVKEYVTTFYREALAHARDRDAEG